MKNSMDSRDRHSAMCIIAVCLLFAAAWIYFSDKALGIFIHNRGTAERIFLFKGFLFITVTSILLYLLIARNIIKTRSIEIELPKSLKPTDSLLEGTGPGLAMARKIVEMYGGTIRVESDGPGHGSCFRFTLPTAVRGAEELN